MFAYFCWRLPRETPLSSVDFSRATIDAMPVLSCFHRPSLVEEVEELSPEVQAATSKVAEANRVLAAAEKELDEAKKRDAKRKVRIAL